MFASNLSLAPRPGTTQHQYSVVLEDSGKTFYNINKTLHGWRSEQENAEAWLKHLTINSSGSYQRDDHFAAVGFWSVEPQIEFINISQLITFC